MNIASLHRENKLNPVVTVSIVSHGDSKKVIRLLESMRIFEVPDCIQIIVTDNLGNEFPEMEDSSWWSFSILRNERAWGFACNHNHASKLAKGKYLCILNPDVVFLQSTLSQLLQRLETSQADIIAPLVVDANGVIQDSFRELPTPLDIIRRRFPGYRFDYAIAESNELIQPDWVPGIFFIMRSIAYRELGGMNEKYRLYFEDVEFCTRARLAGLKLLVDTNLRIQHDAHRASRKRLIYLIWHIQSAIRFFSSSVYKMALKTSK